MGITTSAFAQNAGNQPAAQNSTNAQTSDQATPQKAATLQTVVVTGSHIPRVDLETASPVVTVDAATIKASGKLTLGDLVQDLPGVTGNGVNPAVNNGGGSGSSTIGLRGLGSNRTLILIDGHRVLNKNVNAIPANMIERIDVLTTGASSVYGSDAVGGVVNFILKKDYQGAEFSVNYGESDQNDGAQQGYTFTFGQTSEKGNIMAGVDYNKSDSISAASRKFSANAVTLTTTGHGALSRFVGGSSSSPYGHIQIPTTGPMAAQLAAAYPGCASGFLARNPTASGANALTDYHCYQNSGPNSDKYNYAAVNLLTTPQEHTSLFVLGNYNLGDHVTAYMDAYFNKTSSAFSLAPTVYGTPYGASLSAQSYFNPFGVDYNGVDGAQFNERLSALGSRLTASSNTNGQIITGVKGDITLGSHDWNWDAGLDYGHTSLTLMVNNLPNTGPLYAGSGPSFLNAQGQVQCGTPAAPIALSACTPFDPFNLDSPASKAALAAAASPALENYLQIERTIHVDVSGGVFDLPAGTVQLAAGASYRKDYLHSVVDPLLQVNSLGVCVLGSQCTGAVQGGYNVKEVYAEAFIPVLTDLPGVKSLNVTLGDRYSKYNNVGSTNNAKLAIEWKPIDDLLLRGTVAQVFRAPNLWELYAAPAVSADTVKNDPCTGYTGNPVNPACVNVPTDGSFVNQNVAQNLQDTALLQGAVPAGVKLKAERGKTFDLGAVYSPSWAPGLSATADVWHLYLNDAITPIFTQSVLNLCGADQTYYCQFIQRIASGPSQGQIASNFVDPIVNLGNTAAGGVDFSASYKLPQFDRFGQFTVGVNATYLKYYNVNTAPGTPANTTYYDAGHFMPNGSAQAAACPSGPSGTGPTTGAGSCLFPRWRGQGYLNWQSSNWTASWRMRYIGRFQMGSLDPSQDVHPAGPGLDGLVLKYGATVYNDISLGYNIEPLHTRVDFGVNNLFNKQPPILYANNTLDSDTDPLDFDVVGRFFWGRVTVTF
ncbi:TonB-dependent receptor [Rhodanobacter sp. C03]|uniref:TonB-dependent receptor plug domain-containing protein n=1 Tax=Rhodanobacter sp. C03 TaxID=1945858 RepID=UPI0020C491EA|nr:TonB-dependent receptor [Rhodanobacter sp. C03]